MGSSMLPATPCRNFIMTDPKNRDHLNKMISARITPALHQQCEQAAQRVNLNLSDWLRAVIDPAHPMATHKLTPRKRKPHPPGKISSADPVLIRQLAVACNNLNQIARAINVHMKSQTSVNMLPYLQSMHAQEVLLQEIADQHRSGKSHAS
jgi:Bacterial mobilisation protein (MobC)